jgi:YD repeat-containing protein
MGCRVRQERESGLEGASDISIAFDANGNTTSKTDSTGTTTYSWDFENRLTSVALPGSGGTVNFKYDPFGRRIYKSSSAGTSIYAYDGNNLSEETNGNGTSVARYAQALNIDEPLALLRSGTTSYYQLDGLWSVTSPGVRRQQVRVTMCIRRTGTHIALLLRRNPKQSPSPHKHHV